MSITAIVWLALYCSAGVLALLFAPFYGVLGYMLEYYMRPELKWWGDELPNLRWNLIISMLLGVGFIVHRNSLRKMVEVTNPSLKWLLALGITMVVVTGVFAVNRDVSWSWAVQWMKMGVIFPLLIVGSVRDRRALNAVLVAHMLGAFWWGWDAYNDPKREAGRLVNIGSGDTLDDNSAAAHLLTVLPFTLVLLLTEKNKHIRIPALIAAPFVINTLILCNSRGATVGIAAGLLAAVALVRSGYRTRLAGAGVAVALSFFLLADEQFITRQQTTTQATDNSSQERLASWRGGIRLALERPFGSGGRGFHLLSPQYIPEIVAAHGGDMRAPHNTFVMVLSEWGIAGFVFYLALYGSALRMLQRVKKRATAEEAGFFYWRALSVQLAIISYLVAQMFSDRLYAEAGYWMIALAFALNRIQLTEHAAVSEPAKQTAQAAAWAPSWSYSGAKP